MGQERILITGAAGMVGANLVRELLTHSEEFELCLVDDLSSGSKQSLEGIGANLQVVDIGSESFKRLFLDFRPTKVIHLAALFANQNSVDRPIKDLLVNGKATLNLLELSKEANVSYFLNASSSCVYGNSIDMHEGVVGTLETPYAITKLLGENYGSYYNRNYNINVRSFRLFNSYGPWDRPGQYRSVIPNFIANLMRRQPIVVYGDGSDTRSYTYVSDTCSILMQDILAPREKSIEVVNLGAVQQASVLELISILEEILDVSANLIFKPIRGWDGVRDRRPNVDLLTSSYSIEDTISLRAGLKKTILWVEENKEVFFENIDSWPQ